MKRLILALPIAGLMMTAPLAYAQQPTPAQAPAAQAPTDVPTQAPAGEQPAQASDNAQPTDPAAEPKNTSCVDLSEGNTDGQAAGEQEGEVAAAPGENASETEPVQGSDSGTAPGGSGSSGWTGGLGGSDIGTSQSEELETSPDQDHPAVASGLDPISGETAVEGPKAPVQPIAVQATAPC